MINYDAFVFRYFSEDEKIEYEERNSIMSENFENEVLGKKTCTKEIAYKQVTDRYCSEPVILQTIPKDLKAFIKQTSKGCLIGDMIKHKVNILDILSKDYSEQVNFWKNYRTFLNLKQ